ASGQLCACARDDRSLAVAARGADPDADSARDPREQGDLLPLGPGKLPGRPRALPGSVAHRGSDRLAGGAPPAPSAVLRVAVPADAAPGEPRERRTRTGVRPGLRRRRGDGP